MIGCWWDSSWGTTSFPTSPTSTSTPSVSPGCGRRTNRHCQLSGVCSKTVLGILWRGQCYCDAEVSLWLGKCHFGIDIVILIVNDTLTVIVTVTSMSLWHSQCPFDIHYFLDSHCHCDTLSLIITVTWSMLQWHGHCHFDTPRVTLTFYVIVAVIITVTVIVNDNVSGNNNCQCMDNRCYIALWLKQIKLPKILWQCICSVLLSFTDYISAYVEFVSVFFSLIVLVSFFQDI